MESVGGGDGITTVALVNPGSEIVLIVVNPRKEERRLWIAGDGWG